MRLPPILGYLIKRALQWGWVYTWGSMGHRILMRTNTGTAWSARITGIDTEMKYNAFVSLHRHHSGTGIGLDKPFLPIPRSHIRFSRVREGYIVYRK